MVQVFTSEELKGYEFRCYSAPANTGFKHICEVYKDNMPVESCKSVVNWGNRTWESYQYATVFESSKDKVQCYEIDRHEDPAINTDFLEKLVEGGYIHDYGTMENGETVILMDGWYQVEGEEEREYKEGVGMVKTGNFKKSVYAKLMELAEKRLLSPSVVSTLLNVDYVFTDEYDKCWECGTVHNTYYGDLTYLEEEGMLLCDDCINSSDRVERLIDQAKEDIRYSLKPTIDQKIIEELGYSLVIDDTFSFEQKFWGATYMTEEYAKEFIKKYNGFIQIYEVAQFVTPFQIWIPNENLKNAQAEIKFKFNL